MTLFCSGYIEIKTFDGTKWLKDIKIGDLVLTHLGNYREVFQVKKIRYPRYFNSGVFDIYFLVEDDACKGGFREEGIHRITGDHLVFCSNGTKKFVRDIKKGDILSISKGRKARVILSLEIPKENHGEFLYGLEIKKDHSYYADNVCVND